MTGLAATEAEYDSFARFYDAFTAASDYEVWTRNVLELAEALGLTGRRLLDLACGTGNSFLPFRERGFEVTASDVSGAMLGEAARKAPDVQLVHADIRTLGRVGRFDLVTCFDDALNYLLDDAGLSRAFATLAANLAPGGIGLFDLNTLLTYQSTFARDRVTTSGGTLFAWRGGATSEIERGCLVTATIEVFAPAGDGLYERTTSHHTQRHHPRERVLSLLAGEGLDPMSVHGVNADASLDPELDEARHPKALFAVRSAKGGDPE